MVAGRGADHAALQLRSRQVGHLVVGAAQLEAEHALHVLALEVNRLLDALRQGRREFQRGFMGDVVDARGQDFLQIVGSHGRMQTKFWIPGRR
jgi:hypothetical protein